MAKEQFQQAGWHRDPRMPNQERWWTGTTWTEDVRPAGTIGPPPSQWQAQSFSVPATNAAPGWNGSHPAHSTVPPMSWAAPPTGSNWNPWTASAPGKNGRAVASLTNGIITLVIVWIPVVMWLAPLSAIGAIVWGVLGLRQARTTRAGKKRSIWGLVLGGIALPASLVVLGATVLGSLWTTSQADGQMFLAQIEQEIDAGIEAQSGLPVDSVECPTAPPLNQGSSFDCQANLADGTTVLVEVRIQDDVGSFVWEVRS